MSNVGGVEPLALFKDDGFRNAELTSLSVAGSFQVENLGVALLVRVQQSRVIAENFSKTPVAQIEDL